MKPGVSGNDEKYLGARRSLCPTLGFFIGVLLYGYDAYRDIHL